MYFSVSKSFEGKILQVLKVHRLFFVKLSFKSRTVSHDADLFSF
jgi:hypothetical protein